MKKNWLMRTAYLVLAVLLISSVVVSGTFAKYTWSSTATTSTATVALFQFDINGTTIDSADDTVSFNLFDTTAIMDENLDTGALEATEADVEDAGANIAPGMGGKFDVVIENKGEVTIEYNLTATNVVNNDNIPLVFSTDNATWGTLDDTIGATTGVLNVGAAAETKTVYWKWAFNPADTTDTALGFAGTATYSVDLNITVTQVN